MHVNNKNAGKPRVLAINALQAAYLPLTMMQSHRQSGWEDNPVWQTGLPALSGHPTYHVNVIKLTREIIWTGGLPHLGGLPNLPGVPRLRVNSP